jgi:hypothetical protein
VTARAPIVLLTGITGFMQLVLVSTAQIADTLAPTQSTACLRDHDHRNP